MNTVFIGFESGSDYILKIYNKEINKEKNFEIVNTLHKHGIRIQVGFIMFNPYSRIEDLKQNAIFLKEIGELFRMFPLTRAVDLFPGSSLLNKLTNDGLLLKCYSYKCDLILDYKFLDKKVERIYLIINEQYDSLSQKYDSELNNIFYRHEYASYYMLRNELNEVHYTYFINILDSDCSEEAVLRINNDRLYKVNAILNKVKEGVLC